MPWPRPGCPAGERCSTPGRTRRSGPPGRDVGLPDGQMGNSEVGHLNLGAGRPVLQDLPRIDAAILDGTFRTNPVLVDACRAAAAGDRRLALISLVGPGGVHANDRHLVALAEMAHELGVRDVVVHGLLDGRDTPPRSAAGYLVDLESRLAAAHPRRASRPSAGATTPWIATSAGTASGEATTRSSTGSASRPRRRGAAIAAAYARGRGRRVRAAQRHRRRRWPAARRRRRGALQLPRRSGPPADPRPRRRRWLPRASIAASDHEPSGSSR